jgi:hypothetical protein
MSHCLFSKRDLIGTIVCLSSSPLKCLYPHIDVEEGGETNFPRIDIAVKPKKGRAVLWPSVMDDNLLQQDARTHHEAKPVIKGMKLAANAWIHL